MKEWEWVLVLWLDVVAKWRKYGSIYMAQTRDVDTNGRNCKADSDDGDRERAFSPIPTICSREIWYPPYNDKKAGWDGVSCCLRSTHVTQQNPHPPFVQYHRHHITFYISIESLKRKTPVYLNTPSTPPGNFSTRQDASPPPRPPPPTSDDLSTTRAKPWALMASTNAGTIVC